MQILRTHIIFSVLKTFALLIAILSGLQFFINLISQLGDIGSGEYTLINAVKYSFLILPNAIYNILPIIVLLGTLLSLSILSAHNEIIVMRTSGVSDGKIINAAFMSVILLLIIMIPVGEIIAPHATYIANTKKFAAQNNITELKIEDAFWAKDENNFIRISKVLPGLQLQGVSQYKFGNNHKLISASFSEYAFFSNNQWYLKNTAQTDFKQDDTSYQTKTALQPWQVNISKELLQSSKIEPQDMNLLQLYSLIYHHQLKGVILKSYSLEFWRRIFMPLTSFVIVILAFPFAFTRQRSSNIGLKLFAGIIIGLAFYILNRLLGSFSLVYNISPITATIIPSLLSSIIGLLFLYKLR